MNRFAYGIVSLVVIGALSIPALAQQQGGPPPGGPPPVDPQPGSFPDGAGGFDQGGRGPGPRGGLGPGLRGGRGRAGLQGGGPAVAPGPEVQKYDALRNYIEVVDRFTQLSRNVDSAGVAAVVSATDLLRQRGPESAIAYLNKTLPDVKSPTIQRAIRIQLVDLYKQSGQSEKALEQLDVLMKAQP